MTTTTPKRGTVDIGQRRELVALVVERVEVRGADGGRSWEHVSLLGEADFHALVAAHGHIYGYDSTNRRFTVSPDGRQSDIRSWGRDLGLWGLGPNGQTYQRADGRWELRQKLAGQPQALLVGEKELFAAVSDGDATAIYVSSDRARSWRLRYSSTNADACPAASFRRCGTAGDGECSCWRR